MAELTLVSYFTESHRQLLDLMLESAKPIESKIIFQGEQICKTARFREDGWNASTADKIKKLCTLPIDGSLYFFADTDVVFSRDFKEWCIAVANSSPNDFVLYGYDTFQWCTGTMLFRQTERVARWWNAVYQICETIKQNDQDGLDALKNAGRPTLSMGILPIKNVCNLASLVYPERPAMWQGENFVIPSTCKAWHSNWTVGVEQKIAMSKIAYKEINK